MPKEFKCVICGATVSKRKSYACGDGRACREHQEAQEAHEKSEEERRAKVKQQKEGKKHKKHKKHNGWTPSDEDMEWVRDHINNMHYCHVCQREDGLTPQEFLFQHMMDIHESKGKWADLLCARLTGDAEKVQNNQIHKDHVARADRVIIPCNRPQRMTFKIDKRIWQLVSFGVLDIWACGYCRTKYKLQIADWYSKQIKDAQERTDEHFKKMLDGDKSVMASTMAMMGAVVGPALDQAVEERQKQKAQTN